MIICDLVLRTQFNFLFKIEVILLCYLQKHDKIILVLERFELFIWNLHTKQLLENQAFVLLDLRPKGIYRLIQHMHVHVYILITTMEEKTRRSKTKTNG